MLAIQDSFRPVSTGARLHPARVFVIDDELLLAQSLRLVLAKDFEVTVATNPEQAFSAVAAGQFFDVILCSVTTRGLSGIELRRRIHAIEPEQAARVVFILSGPIQRDVRAALDEVPNAILQKPIDLDGLREMIRRRIRTPWPAPHPEL
jgi:CheY-like chemotaxis protein